MKRILDNRVLCVLLACVAASYVMVGAIALLAGAGNPRDCLLFFLAWALSPLVVLFCFVMFIFANAIEGRLPPTLVIIAFAVYAPLCAGCYWWFRGPLRERLNRLNLNSCHACGYDLRGTPDATSCPECGADVRP